VAKSTRASEPMYIVVTATQSPESM
jgi:hypothetical protein